MLYKYCGQPIHENVWVNAYPINHLMYLFPVCFVCCLPKLYQNIKTPTFTPIMCSTVWNMLIPWSVQPLCEELPANVCVVCLSSFSLLFWCGCWPTWEPCSTDSLSSSWVSFRPAWASSWVCRWSWLNHYVSLNPNNVSCCNCKQHEWKAAKSVRLCCFQLEYRNGTRPEAMLRDAMWCFGKTLLTLFSSSHSCCFGSLNGESVLIEEHIYCNWLRLDREHSVLHNNLMFACS